MAFFLLVPLASLSVYANEPENGADDWKTIHINNFQIHFQQRYEQAARSVAAIYMLYLPVLEKEFDHKPERIDVVVRDNRDLPNGASSPIPENTNTIYLTPPIDGALINQQNWIDLVVRHELTHLYHLDKATGAPNVLRSFFGRFLFFFPSLFQPNWVVEGLATYHETNQELGYGRGSNGFFDAIMRLEHKRGFRSITSATYNKSGFPTGVSYYYGYYFFEFLHTEYGSDIIKQYIDSYNDRIIPFRIDDNVKKNFGVSIYSLWASFNRYLEKKFGQQIEAITNAGITQTKISGGFSLLNQQAKYDNKGNLYYIMSDGYSSPVIRRLSADNKESSDLVDLVRPGYFDVLNNGKLVYSQLNLCGGNTFYYDLYIRDQDSGEERKLGSCQRYKFVRWHPSGNSIFATRYSDGKSELVLLDLSGNKTESLLQTEGNDTIGSFAVSPNGRKLIVSLFRQEHGWELYQINTEQSNNLTRLTNNNDVELDPSYSYDGKFIVYTSNHGNIYNIWRLSIGNPDQSPAPEAITNVISTAFGASIHPDNSTITYSQLNSLGYQLHSAKIELRRPTILERETLVTHETPSFAGDEPVQPVTEEAVDYSALNSYSAPAWWLPFVSFDSAEQKIGLFTAGNDQLRHHSYSLRLAYTRAPDHPPLEGFEGVVQYTYNNQALLTYSSESSVYQKDYSNDKSLYQNKNDFSFATQFYLYNNKQHRSQITAALIRSENIVDLETELLTQETKDVGGLMLVYSGTRQYYYNYTPVEGSLIRLLAETHMNTSASFSEKGNASAIQLSHNFNLGNAHSLNLRYTEAKRDEEIFAFRLGGASQKQTISFNKQFYDLPGYEQGAKELITREFRLLTLNYTLPITKNAGGALAPPVGFGEKYIQASIQSASIDKPLFMAEDKIYSNFIFSFNTELSLGFDLIRIPVKFYYAKGLDKDIGTTATGLAFLRAF